MTCKGSRKHSRGKCESSRKAIWRQVSLSRFSTRGEKAKTKETLLLRVRGRAAPCRERRPPRAPPPTVRFQSDLVTFLRSVVESHYVRLVRAALDTARSLETRLEPLSRFQYGIIPNTVRVTRYYPAVVESNVAAAATCTERAAVPRVAPSAAAVMSSVCSVTSRLSSQRYRYSRVSFVFEKKKKVSKVSRFHTVFRDLVTTDK